MAVSRWYGLLQYAWHVWPKRRSHGGTITTTRPPPVLLEDHYPVSTICRSDVDVRPDAERCAILARVCRAVSAPRIKISPTCLVSDVREPRCPTFTPLRSQPGNDVLNVNSIVAAKTTYATKLAHPVAVPDVPAASFGSFNINIIATPFFNQQHLGQRSVTLH